MRAGFSYFHELFIFYTHIFLYLIRLAQLVTFKNFSARQLVPTTEVQIGHWYHSFHPLSPLQYIQIFDHFL